MRTIVLGGGIIGVTTAYCLAAKGVDDVVLVDRGTEVASETSSVNTGVCAPGHSFAWASPRAPLILIRSLFDENTALRMHPSRMDREMLAWYARFLRECTTARARRNTLTKYRLASYSRDAMVRLLEEHPISYNQSPPGMLYLYRDPERLEAAMDVMALLRDRGEQQDRYAVEQCVEVEPALVNVRGKLAGAIFGPQDQGGECRVLAQKLGAIFERLGGTLLLDTQITEVVADGGSIKGVRTSRGPIIGDNYIVALGSYSAAAVKPLGIKLPVYPVKGYSVTAPVEDPAGAPRISGVDEETLVAWSRIGDRIRLTSTADVIGHDMSMDKDDYGNIFNLGGEFFPGIDFSRARLAVGFRPMTPDGPPALGPAGYPNLYLNTGHGHLGFTMSFGSAEIISDLIVGNTPAIDVSGMEPTRWMSRSARSVATPVRRLGKYTRTRGSESWQMQD